MGDVSIFGLILESSRRLFSKVAYYRLFGINGSVIYHWKIMANRLYAEISNFQQFMSCLELIQKLLGQLFIWAPKCCPLLDKDVYQALRKSKSPKSNILVWNMLVGSLNSRQLSHISSNIIIFLPLCALIAQHMMIYSICFLSVVSLNHLGRFYSLFSKFNGFFTSLFKATYYRPWLALLWPLALRFFYGPMQLQLFYHKFGLNMLRGFFHDKPLPWSPQLDSNCHFVSPCSLSKAFPNFSIQDISLNRKALIFLV